MSERERLIELLSKAPFGYTTLGDRYYKSAIEKIADHLLENSVIVPPVKVGEIVYKLRGTGFIKYKVDYFDIFKNSFKIHLIANNWSDFVFAEDIGETIFLTKEEAEKALKGDATNG